MVTSTRAKMLLALVSVIILVTEGVAAAGPPSACSSTASSLSLCLPAVQGEDPPFPTDACCYVVRTTDTGCLCNVVTQYSGAITAMGVNLSAALQLPKNCKHALPIGYSCDGNSHCSLLTVTNWWACIDHHNADCNPLFCRLCFRFLRSTTPQALERVDEYTNVLLYSKK